MRKYIKIAGAAAMVMLAAAGCGDSTDKKEPEAVVIEDFNVVHDDQRTQVIVRDEPAEPVTETAEEPGEAEVSAEGEAEAVIAYADRIAGDNVVAYNVEAAVYEDGAARVEYPQLTGMANEEKQQEINENIKKSVVESISADNLSSFEIRYETATKGDGIVSFIFRGIEYYENSAYPNNIIKTLNIDLNTGKNVRLKDFADIASVVSSLELSNGYTIINEGVDIADFSAFLNNGSVTDYAMTLLDYDFDFSNLAMTPTGYSAIRDNHLILFIKAEHAMGDYVELEFGKNL